MNFRYRFMQFMSGRYGTDELFYWIFFAAAVLSLINIFLRWAILQVFVYILVFYALFRFLSRNFEARRRENRWFREKTSLFKRQIELYNQRKLDKCHVYKKCPRCKAILKLPHRIGTHKTVCPRCSKEFTVKVKK